MPSATVADRLDAQVHRMVFAVAAVAGAVFGLSALAMFSQWPPEYRWQFTSVYVAITAADAVVAFCAWRGRIPASRGNDVMLLLLGLGIVAQSLNLIGPPSVDETVSPILGMVAAAALLLSWSRFWILNLGNLAIGVVLSARFEGGAHLGTHLVLFAAAAATATLLQGLRLRTATRVETLLLENEEKRAQLEEALAQLKRTHEQAVAREKLSALGTLVAGVAHEINNPLTFMRGNLELAEETLRDAARRGTPLSPKEAAAIADQQLVALRGIDRIGHITKSLKSVARSPESTATCPQDVNAIVDGVLTVAAARMPANVAVVRELRASHLADVNASEISQVVLNLVLNAMEAMPKGGTLRVATRDVDEGACIEVRDSGAGIPADVRSRLFTPFYTTKAGGTGLGLSISHRIVEEHGGAVAVEDAPGGGALFRVELPRTRASRPPMRKVLDNHPSSPTQ